jgi:hypothetical protein|tara:strand:+ start:295 stop:423 length:129 start_codon:yes stop_codon:yes gene_type:complete
MNQNKIKKVSVKFPNFVSKDNIEYEGNTYQVENVNETIGGLR